MLAFSVEMITFYNLQFSFSVNLLGDLELKSKLLSYKSGLCNLWKRSLGLGVKGFVFKRGHRVSAHRLRWASTRWYYPCQPQPVWKRNFQKAILTLPVGIFKIQENYTCLDTYTAALVGNKINIINPKSYAPNTNWLSKQLI